jgi:hypothetical protein
MNNILFQGRAIELRMILLSIRYSEVEEIREGIRN